MTIRGATGGLPAAQRTTFDTALTQQLDASADAGRAAAADRQYAATAAEVQALQNAITSLIIVADDAGAGRRS